MSSDLTAEEEERELDGILERLTQRFIGFGKQVPSIVNREFKNLDSMRCLDKLCTSPDIGLFYDIEITRKIINRRMHMEAAPFLTSEMVSAMARVMQAYSDLGQASFSAEKEESMFVFILQNYKHADTIFHLLEDRGVTSTDAMLDFLESSSISDHPKALRDGAL